MLSARQLIEVEVDLAGTGFDAKGRGFEGLAVVGDTETIASEREAWERKKAVGIRPGVEGAVQEQDRRVGSRLIAARDAPAELSADAGEGFEAGANSIEVAASGIFDASQDG